MKPNGRAKAYLAHFEVSSPVCRKSLESKDTFEEQKLSSNGQSDPIKYFMTQKAGSKRGK